MYVYLMYYMHEDKVACVKCIEKWNTHMSMRMYHMMS